MLNLSGGMRCRSAFYEYTVDLYNCRAARKPDDCVSQYVSLNHC